MRDTKIDTYMSLYNFRFIIIARKLPHSSVCTIFSDFVSYFFSVFNTVLNIGNNGMKEIIAV